MTDAEIEAALMDKLYAAVKDMFGFTGWDDNCDKEAVVAVDKVQAALTMVKNWRQLRAAVGKSEGRK